MERRAGESSLIAHKDEEISLLRAQLAEAQARAEGTNAEVKELAVKNATVMAELAKERTESTQYRAGC